MTGGPLRRVVVALVMSAALASCGSVQPTQAVRDDLPGGPAATASYATTTTTTARLRVGQSAWVSVSVATLWRSPSAPRAVDAPALASPTHIRRWLADMTLDERRGLGTLEATQALLGDRVRIVRLRGTWARIVVPSQPSPLDGRGYPGWVPRRQLTATLPVQSDTVATVVRRTAWLLTDTTPATRIFPISYGTRLRVVGHTARDVRVAMPDGTVRRLRSAGVIVHQLGEPAIAPTRASLVAVATSFTGLDYLWGGLSGFGLDCSGLTWLTYRVHGLKIPRDAAPQSQHGTVVRTLRRGDLMFYARDGLVHHVTLYIGNGRMVQAPGTGQQVFVGPTSQWPLSGEYVGARRYLTVP